jgi:uncharacterized membrane protein
VKFEQLQRVWQSHHEQAAQSQPMAFAAETIAKSAKLNTSLWRRDWIETAAAVFVIGIFGSTLFTDDLSPISILGVLVIVASTMGSIWILHRTRTRHAPISPDQSLLEHARLERQRVESQIALMQRVTLWYVGPLTLGAILFVFGLFEPWWVALIAAGGFLVIFAIVGWVIHRMNQQSVQQSLGPLHAQLTDLIHSLETPEAE